MKYLKVIVSLFFTAALLLPVAFTRATENQPSPQATAAIESESSTNAPAAFDNQTNGFVSQEQFELDREVFDEHETVADGLGPVYNAQGCGECHQNPTSG